ncbi:hypothetical protein LQR31_18285 [Chromobacterium vaccinii]|uniref:hypothetical protein n=1 Tax=Chromobacterium vaccinii TaxID=1108595 RepID=UPI001E53EE42|nr:hypothetical protein [Chromobacterium vaccinii]MCD4486427.1 hypothetical protein [Chromobacterium vaccinii]
MSGCAMLIEYYVGSFKPGVTATLINQVLIYPQLFAMRKVIHIPASDKKNG